MSKGRDWSEWLTALDANIRGGRLSEVQAELRSVEGPSIPENLRDRFANICRRVGMAPLGLRILSENVIRDGELRSDARPQDLLEYGVALQRTGAVQEAKGILRSIDSTAFPEADLYLAFCEISTWDYSNALKLIDSYLQKTESIASESYRRAVARLNRLECLHITGQHDILESSSAELLNELQASGNNLLLGNALEIEAQSRVASGRFDDALLSLAKARQLIPESSSADSLFISKWQAIAQSRRDNSIDSIQKARADALNLGHWETLRDLDMHGLRIQPSEEWAAWVYFGTPFSAYRSGLKKSLNWQPPSETWVRTDVIMGTSSENGPQIVLENIKEGRAGLAHRLILLLASDFYRPFRGGEIFSRIFPDERFNPVTSMNRVHQQIGEARQLIEDLKWPFRLEEGSGKYSLRWTQPGRLFVRNQVLNLDADAVQIEFLRHHFKSEDLSTQQAATAMDKSASSVRSLLNRAVEKNLLGRYGSGASIRYNFLTTES